MILLITAPDWIVARYQTFGARRLFALGIVWITTGPAGAFEALLDGIFRAGPTGASSPCALLFWASMGSDWETSNSRAPAHKGFPGPSYRLRCSWRYVAQSSW
jgi:hypothetical protein